MSTRYDHAARRRGVRKGRERGCWVYIPGEALREAGVSTEAPPPYYRLWPSGRRFLVQLYREP